MTNTTNTSRDRLGSVGVRGLTALLLAATDGRCAICADVLVIGAPATHPKRVQVSHVRPARGSRREGWVSGNLFAGCGACNDRTGDRDLTSALPLFRIPSGVIVWTDTEARRAGKIVPTTKINSDEHDDLWTKINSVIN